jgi:hypothetical protein
MTGGGHRDALRRIPPWSGELGAVSIIRWRSRSRLSAANVFGGIGSSSGVRKVSRRVAAAFELRVEATDTQPDERRLDPSDNPARFAKTAIHRSNCCQRYCASRINRSGKEIERRNRERVREACEKSLYRFVEEAFPTIEGVPFKPGRHLEMVCEHLEHASNPAIAEAADQSPASSLQEPDCQCVLARVDVGVSNRVG